MTKQREVKIDIRGFAVGYDNNVALTIPNLKLQGNIIALAGHNGAGKSTFLKALLELLPPIKGNFRIYDPATGKALRPEMHMAFCPETGSVFSDITVEEYLKLWCRLKCNNAKYLFKEGKRLLELLELSPLLSMHGRELSKGQRQRVQIAAGFFSKPDLFLFDEPFDGLDVQRTHELMQIIRSYTPQTAFIVSSHRMDVVERLADQVIVLQDGMVKTSGLTVKVSKELCGSMYRIEHAAKPHNLSAELQSAFPNAHVYVLGDSVRLIAPVIPPEHLTSLIKKIDKNGATMSEIQPTLTDAMSFHLKMIKQGKS